MDSDYTPPQSPVTGDLEAPSLDNQFFMKLFRLRRAAGNSRTRNELLNIYDESEKIRRRLKRAVRRQKREGNLALSYKLGTILRSFLLFQREGIEGNVYYHVYKRLN